MILWWNPKRHQKICKRVKYVKWINMKLCIQQGYFSLSQSLYLPVCGPIFLWTLWRDYPSLRDLPLSWWWWTDYPSMATSSICHIPTSFLWWHRFFSPMSSSCMACPRPLSPTMILFLLVLFGENYFISKVSLWHSVQPITLSWMVKPSLWISALKLTYGVMLSPSLRTEA